MAGGQVISGKGTSFWLDDAPGGTLTDVSTFMNSAAGGNNQGELDGTNFQPGVAKPLKNFIPDFEDRSFDFGGNWSSDAEVFWSAVNGEVGLNYEYGPNGTDPGETKITGLLNVMGYTGPQSNMGMTTWSAKGRVTSRVVGVFT